MQRLVRCLGRKNSDCLVVDELIVWDSQVEWSGNPFRNSASSIVHTTVTWADEVATVPLLRDLVSGVVG